MWHRNKIIRIYVQGCLFQDHCKEQTTRNTIMSFIKEMGESVMGWYFPAMDYNATIKRIR